MVANLRTGRPCTRRPVHYLERCPMRSTFFIPVIGCLALALAGCRGDSTGTPSEPGDRVLLASLHGADAGLGLSAWSDPVNLGPVVNSDGLDQDPTLSP